MDRQEYANTQQASVIHPALTQSFLWRFFHSEVVHSERIKEKRACDSPLLCSLLRCLFAFSLLFPSLHLGNEPTLQESVSILTSLRISFNLMLIAGGKT
mmetsp:Transcript_48/g.172  ORF Transcript_48/g.172 Transcript_48/m.172 type:complete len:99 (-) Transcript_48:940-1236(-)